ncbi:TIGR03503 family protein [Vibrio coralliilyticus]|uniref:Glutamate synthase n=1 Tax=Vibrio coralliilyticus TaxID=190893 RepID=A0AAJ3KFP1_9VIBR|nr:TIGR03503 family protein [Vibrio coralliilyticus]AIS54062.1 glutamate synthase [Vibrio coralliilyticus]AIW19679.1 glutamate synthase [Vibrio coralliilyticus]AXN31331.1 TIGR03503 family protein [Vibrio coralliilyticus]KPH27709.1 glutamate synthase [Vibrio coralliilyticus]MCC2523210.1 TIGR03503 family protein [Vibrio coralliilyticus]
MLRIWFALLGLLVSTFGYAEESSMSLLDNRFRVDPTIKQITFVIYRAERSRPVVLVRPDGKKYYAWRSPDNVRWYQESSMDIISIDNPMPGPWQAIGKITPKNKIILISHLELSTDTMPTRLFQNEEIKFTARLTADGKPLVLRDFLERVKLMVTFTKYVENEEELIKEARPIPYTIGEFADDGRGLDEVAGDGVFTVSLNISPEPGKYRVRITSGNGVFLRAQEQEVLIYPTPIETTFIQSREEGKDHQVVFSGEQGMIQPGSLAAQIEHKSPDNSEISAAESASEESEKVVLTIPYNGEIGNYSWMGQVFATEMGSGRPLAFPIKEHTYSVLEEIDFAETRRLQEEERMMQQKLMEEMRLIQMREEKRTRTFIMIGVGNVVMIILGLAVWFVMRKLRAKKEMMPEMQLEMPKK